MTRDGDNGAMGTALLRRASGRYRLARVALALFLPLPACAWNAAGHRLVACIAWQELDDETRATAARLLRVHPDHARWLRRAAVYADDAGRSAFIEASTWPDDIRQDRRFYSAGIDPPTPTRPGYPDMERRGDWHYINYAQPGGDPAAPGTPISGRIDRALGELEATLASASATDAERSYALPWLIHLVADAHQPLHSSTRVGADGEVERGGPTVANPYNPRKPTSTLHAYWDDLPGPPWLRGERLDAACQALAANAAPVATLTPAQWLRESWRLARDHGYPPDTDAVPTISAQFDAQARNIARQRITQAGARLAELLRGLLK